MAFDKKTWANNQAGGTPLDASGLNDLESRIEDEFGVISGDLATKVDASSGSWTATLVGSTTSPTPKPTATCRYYRVGNMVTVGGHIGEFYTGGFKGHLSIEGLPFISSSQSGNIAIGTTMCSNTNDAVVAMVDANRNYINLYNKNGSVFSFTSTSTPTHLYFSVTYICVV